MADNRNHEVRRDLYNKAVHPKQSAPMTVSSKDIARWNTGVTMHQPNKPVFQRY